MNESIDNYIDRLQNLEKFFNQYYFTIGIITSDALRGFRISNKKKAEKVKKEAQDKNINNAMLLYIHEYGSPVKKIPDRHLIGKSIAHINKHYINNLIDRVEKMYLDGKSVGEIEETMKKWAIKMQQEVQIGVQRDKLNLKKLKIRKGAPLYDTGDMVKSITVLLWKNNRMML